MLMFEHVQLISAHRPAMIFLHGGGWLSGGPGKVNPARRGLVVRGSRLSPCGITVPLVL